MKVLILGDLHGQVRLLPGLLASAKRRFGVTAAIQVGDFGFFKGLSTALRNNRLPIPVHAIDGNHEDHRFLARCHVQELTTFGPGDHLRVHGRGSVFDLGGLSIGCLGGALHADRDQVIGNDTNWVTDADADHAAAVFNDLQPQIIITHSCPHSIGVGMLGSPAFAPGVRFFCTDQGFDTGPEHDCGEPGLKRLWRQLQYRPQIWIFGHFHRVHENIVEGCHFVCAGSSDGTDGHENPIPIILDTDALTVSIHHPGGPHG